MPVFCGRPSAKNRCDAEAHQGAAGEEAGRAVGRGEAAEEGRGAVGAGDDRQRQREQGDAGGEPRQGRHGARQRHHARQLQHGRAHHHDEHEHEPVDQPLEAARAPLAVGGGVGRRHAVQRVDGEARHDVDHGPEARLRDRGRPDGHDRPHAGRRTEQGRQVGDVRAHHGVERSAEQQRVVAPVPVDAAGDQDAAQPECHFAEGEEHEPAARHEVDGLGDADPQRPGRAEVVHHPAVAERQGEVEQERQQDQRPALARREVAAGLHRQRHAGPGVDQRRDRGPDRRQAEDVGPPRRELPHREGRVPRQGEEARARPRRPRPRRRGSAARPARGPAPGCRRRIRPRAGRRGWRATATAGPRGRRGAGPRSRAARPCGGSPPGGGAPRAGVLGARARGAEVL